MAGDQRREKEDQKRANRAVTRKSTSAYCEHTILGKSRA